jgi:hypothetical protein
MNKTQEKTLTNLHYMVLSFLRIVEGLIGILTLGLYFPMWDAELFFFFTMPRDG